MPKLIMHPDEEQILYGPNDLSRLLGVCRPMIDQEIKTKRLKAKRLGNRVLVRHPDLMEWVDSLPDYQMPAGGRTRTVRHMQAQAKAEVE